VVYKGRYDAGALDAMENPAKVSRALSILSGVTLVVAGLFIAGVLAARAHLRVTRPSMQQRPRRDARGIQAPFELKDRLGRVSPPR
jgi:hypothetical protein